MCRTCTTILYDPITVGIAAALTIALSAGLISYAIKTDTDFTMMGGLLFMGCFILLFASILSFFFPSKYAKS